MGCSLCYIPHRKPLALFKSCCCAFWYWVQGAPQGRLLVYDPRTHYTQQLADGIWFAKGVALSGVCVCSAHRARESAMHGHRATEARHSHQFQLLPPTFATCAADNESYVLVAETFGCRVLRHWLQGPAAGTTEV